MGHKELCRQLKKIRKDMADKLGIDLHQTECTYPGECSGTCPKCQREENILSKALLSGAIAVGAVALSACGTSNNDTGDVSDYITTSTIVLGGDMEYVGTPLSGEVTIPFDDQYETCDENCESSPIPEGVIYEACMLVTGADKCELTMYDDETGIVECLQAPLTDLSDNDLYYPFEEIWVNVYTGDASRDNGETFNVCDHLEVEETEEENSESSQSTDTE